MKIHFIIGQFQTEVLTLQREVYETEVLNIDFVFVAIERSNSIFAECNKYDFKQSKAFQQEIFHTSVYKPKIKAAKTERRKK